MKGKVKGPKPLFGFVYVFQCQTTKLVKIGYSLDVDRRLSQVRVGPTQIDLVTKVPVEWDLIRQVESGLHNIFGNRRVRGEWFDVSVESVLKAMESIEYLVERARELEGSSGLYLEC